MQVATVRRLSALMMFVAGIICAQGLVGTSPGISPGSAPANTITAVDLEISIPFIPRVGEMFTATLTIYCKNDLEPDRLGREGPDYKVIFEGDIEIINGKDQIIYDYMKKGETRMFKAQMVIKEAKERVGIAGSIVTTKRPQFTQGANIEIFLVDPQTGQYGSKKQWSDRKYGVLAKYNNIEPQWLSEIDLTWVDSNCRIVQEMIKFESALTDSEALCLHQDNYLLIINAVGDTNATDAERIQHLLKAGWLEAQRSGAESKEAWLKDFMEKNKGDWGGNSNLNFFRNDNPSNYDNLSNNPSENRITTTFIGTWIYQDHLYSKENGLSWSYTAKPIKTAEVGIRAYWTGQGQIFVGWGSTDSDGDFTITTELIPYGATNVRAFPILYTWGPERYNEKIMVSDPDTSTSTWKNPRDRTIWFLPRPTGTAANYVTPGGICNFGTCYPETATTTITQPRSGAANILETYLHARTFMNPQPTRPLRAMWEPGYTHATQMNMLHCSCDDTIWVTADALGAPDSSTDEWDDDILLHEFGHYVMKGYAEGPPSDTGGHAWPIDYPERPGLAYGEGWAHFFSARVRTGSGTDTMIVDTKKGIGGGAVYLWHNIENPWINSDVWPDTAMIGGPWCEAAVAGVLWDIYDSHNEIPYPYYPDSNQGFTDTTSDYLSMGFDEIWNIFDNYDPPSIPTNCWNIQHFRSGWIYYGYGYPDSLIEIFYHHYIPGGIPAKPTGLGAELDEDYYVDLTWDKNSEADLNGYRAFRRGRRTVGVYPWSAWTMIAENNSPTDTTHHDSTVQCMYTYEYKVTAFDSIGNESEYSDSVRIDIPQKDQNKSISPFIKNSIISRIQDLELVIPEGNHSIVVKIYDCTGRVIAEQKLRYENTHSENVNFIDRKVSELSNGVYFVDIRYDNAQRAVEKIIIIK